MSIDFEPHVPSKCLTHWYKGISLQISKGNMKAKFFYYNISAYVLRIGIIFKPNRKVALEKGQFFVQEVCKTASPNPSFQFPVQA